MTQDGNRTAVLALGGNAISPQKEVDTITNQFRHTRESMSAIMHLISEGYDLVITHGNGPQVGNALLRTELTADTAPILPLGICVADVAGGMGYMIQQSLQNLLKSENIHRDVVTMITQVLVDKNDPEIENPSKEIGQHYDEKTAASLADRYGWTVRETSSGDWRRVVPSPKPISIVEANVIRELVNAGIIVIAGGGGGIPAYILDNGSLEGLDGVIDKDMTAALLGRIIKAQELFIITDVDNICLNFKTDSQEIIQDTTAGDIEAWLKAGHFWRGSMEPKIRSALYFLKHHGEEVVITSIDNIEKAIQKQAGTRILKK